MDQFMNLKNKKRKEAKHTEVSYTEQPISILSQVSKIRCRRSCLTVQKSTSFAQVKEKSFQY